jgi:hypothetical protein
MLLQSGAGARLEWILMAPLILGAVLLGGCRSASVVYPNAQEAGHPNKGEVALGSCKSLVQFTPDWRSLGGPFEMKQYVTYDPPDKVKDWYGKTLAQWERVDTQSPAQEQFWGQRCPNGIIYLFPKGCGASLEECTKLTYILEVAPSETWIVLFQRKKKTQ